ncbi:hypothetical protein EHYA_02608 [Embleya hyalina]|uniref:Uncharacterized protein n=1 Tax=Embleya hyalina TaxID=516124 RepID=A0A401YK79_9ACTN|nr:hypothetical protein EHYA_02608 [Embleya hyalina]
MPAVVHGDEVVTRERVTGPTTAARVVVEPAGRRSGHTRAWVVMSSSKSSTMLAVTVGRDWASASR